MDNSTTLIIVNLIINLMMFLNHFIDRIKKSSCFGNAIEFNDNIPNNNIQNNNKDNNNTPQFQSIDINKLTELIKNNNIDKKDDKV